MTATDLKFKRDRPGRRISTCGRFAVESDGMAPVSQADRDGSGVMAGVTGGEWCFVPMTAEAAAACNGHVDEPRDWFPTMREAKEAARAVARSIDR